MAVTMHNILRHELIGLNIRITKSENNTLIGLEGKIVNETKNTLTLGIGEKLKKVLKAQVVFQVKIGNDMIEVDGKKLVARPEDRLKR